MTVVQFLTFTISKCLLCIVAGDIRGKLVKWSTVAIKLAKNNTEKILSGKKIDSYSKIWYFIGLNHEYT